MFYTVIYHELNFELNIEKIIRDKEDYTQKISKIRRLRRVFRKIRILKAKQLSEIVFPLFTKI